jgi:hypothetical protein
MTVLALKKSKMPGVEELPCGGEGAGPLGQLFRNLEMQVRRMF